MTKRILIVDDEFGLADIVAAILRENGYEVAIAINGRLGLAQMSERTPDLILLDIMMPVMDGSSMLRELRRQGDWACIPVIMITGLKEALPQEVPAQHQGVLYKPFTYRALLDAVHALLRE